MQAFSIGYNHKKRMEITMVRLRVLEILAEQKHTKYWLWKQMDMSLSHAVI